MADWSISIGLVLIITGAAILYLVQTRSDPKTICVPGLDPNTAVPVVHSPRPGEVVERWDPPEVICSSARDRRNALRSTQIVMIFKEQFN